MLACPSLSLSCVVSSTIFSHVNQVPTSIYFFGHSFPRYLQLITLPVLSFFYIFITLHLLFSLGIALKVSSPCHLSSFVLLLLYVCTSFILYPTSPFLLHDPFLPSLKTPPSLSEPGVQAASDWQGDIVCHISIPRQSPFSPESNYFFQSERFNLL